VRLAHLFDGRDDDGRFRIDPDRPRIDDPDERERLGRFLAGGFVVVRIPGLHEDVLDPGRPRRAPMSTHTDGTWIWSAAVRYFLLTHGIAPEPAFLEHIRASGYVPHRPTDAEQRAVREFLGNR
jgi:hypothetical protein